MSLQPVEEKAPVVLDAGVETPLARRIFGRHLMDMAILLLITVLFSGLRQGDGLFRDTDIWWHLADARALCTSGHFIRVEPYSFTVAGQRWVNPEWLSGNG